MDRDTRLYSNLKYLIEAIDNIEKKFDLKRELEKAKKQKEEQTLEKRLQEIIKQIKKGEASIQELTNVFKEENKNNKKYDNE